MPCILEKHRLLIISGPPGVGKTILAEMLCYTFLSEQWELVPIRSLEDGFAAIADSKKQVFLFDDFLGKVALDRQALAYKNSDLARFMSRVRRSPNARFILTTRAYIFEEARRVSEHLGDQRLDVTKYVLDVGVYTRQIKARILYNHLLVSETPQPYIRALLESNKLGEIVDHKNYNPRVIEAMTDAFRVRDIEPANYPADFIDALNNPSQIWDTAFRTHIDHRCRHLLIAMFFLAEYGVSLVTLRSSFEPLHTAMSRTYGLAHGPKDFEEALRILEGVVRRNRRNFRDGVVSGKPPKFCIFRRKRVMDLACRGSDRVAAIAANFSFLWITRTAESWFQTSEVRFKC
ncbi:hypothetical protein MQ089_14645 [Edwardsiella anguillarum]|uniref:nSTAND3 domain-containing NTPase n=1 Tax=Edwardsiella anguillarum TaxID=1821960 RepID=UPI003211C3F3